MKFFKLIFLVLLPYSAFAENLNQIYQTAKIQDPTFQRAQAIFLGIKEEIPQALALSLPALSASTATVGNKSNSVNDYHARKYQLDLSQDLINTSNFIEYSVAKMKVAQAQFTLDKAKQDLILSVAEQYFSILRAKNDVDFHSAKLAAFSRHLDQTEQRFKVGLTAITNVHEAKARRDDATAQLISAKNTLSDRYEVIGEITGQQINSITTLVQTKVPLTMPIPNNMDNWVQTSLENNLSLLAQKQKLEQNRAIIKQQRAGHMPTLALTGTILKVKSAAPTSIYSNTKSIGLILTVPIFSGGSVLSKTEQAIQSLAATQSEYVRTYRNIESTTRKAFRGIRTQLSEIKALEQATISNQSALKATEAAFDVGTRTMVDVLNAQSELLNARKKFKNAHYDFILETLALKASAGLLSDADLSAVNDWLQKI
ncbi:MAG: TolC family outer membrane protein [Francisellaceae bacterium]|jgi:outer membrane protein|nr:TolC family outer membrane protein [Francisellaceae bacterium]